MENMNVLPCGTLLQGGRFRVERHLGSGGFGNTYQVRHVESGRLLAMKEFYLKGVNERDADSRSVSVSNMDSKPEFDTQKEKFRKEANRLIGLKHPSVVQVYEFFEENGTAYYVMDYLEGLSLSAQMKSQGHPFTENEVLGITSQLLDALGAVHAQNIWHLDLKPGNVMTAADGHVVLIDFGASKQFRDAEGRSLSTSMGLCYTPGYAPTEQIGVETSRIGPWTDLYALGATMYNLLTMQTPPSVSAIQDGEGFVFPPTVSPDMQQLVRWLMEPNRNRRPQSVYEVRAFMDAHFLAHPEATAAAVTELAAPAATVTELAAPAVAPTVAMAGNTATDGTPAAYSDVQVVPPAKKGSGKKWLYVAVGVLLVGAIVTGILLLSTGSKHNTYWDEEDSENVIEPTEAEEATDMEEEEWDDDSYDMVADSVTAINDDEPHDTPVTDPVEEPVRSHQEDTVRNRREQPVRVRQAEPTNQNNTPSTGPGYRLEVPQNSNGQSQGQNGGGYHFEPVGR